MSPEPVSSSTLDSQEVGSAGATSPEPVSAEVSAGLDWKAISTSPEPVPPCGVCRQALAEFGPDLEVVSEGSSGQIQRWTLLELLPAQLRLEEHVTTDEDGRSAGAEGRT